MRKLSEITGEDAMDVLSDLIEPLSEFATDQEFVNLARKGNHIKTIQYALKSHKKALIWALAIIEGENPNEYNPPLLQIPALLIEMMNDPDVMALFPSEQTVTSSGSTTESIEEAKK